MAWENKQTNSVSQARQQNALKCVVLKKQNSVNYKHRYELKTTS